MFTISIQTIKENIMTYFNGTLQEFTYLHEQVTEISNPAPIPGIKLFKDLNIYLEREYCEY